MKTDAVSSYSVNYVQRGLIRRELRRITTDSRRLIHCSYRVFKSPRKIRKDWLMQRWNPPCQSDTSGHLDSFITPYHAMHMKKLTAKDQKSEICVHNVLKNWSYEAGSVYPTSTALFRLPTLSSNSSSFPFYSFFFSLFLYPYLPQRGHI